MEIYISDSCNQKDETRTISMSFIWPALAFMSSRKHNLSDAKAFMEETEERNK